MGKGKYLGEFELLVLLAVVRLRDDAYGVTIRQEIAGRTGRLVTIGSVYASLERMEQKVYLSSRVSESEPRRGGRWKKYFTLTPDGAAAIRRSREFVRRMTDDLNLDKELESV